MVSSILRPRDFLPSDTHAHTIAGTVKMVILLMIRSYVTTDCKTGRSSWSSHMNLLKAGFPTQLWGRRSMPPPTPRIKWLEICPLRSNTLRQEWQGSWEKSLGPAGVELRGHLFLILRAQQPPRLHVLRKLLGGLKGSAAHWCQATRRPLWWSPPWLRRCVHTWEDSGIYGMGAEAGKYNWLARGNSGEMKTTTRVCLSDSLSLPDTYLLHHFPSLCEFCFCKAEGQGLVTDHWKV